ncbi:MAG: N-acetylmuramoyl-L-alanine amidase [Devosia sp.]
MFNALLRIAVLAVLSLFALAPTRADDQQAPVPALPDIVAARVTTTPERARLIVDLTNPTKFAIVSLVSPNRIAVDMQAGSVKFDTAPAPAGAGLVAGYTVTMTEPGRARTLLTLAGPAQVQQAYVLNAFADQPARLVVDLIPDTPEDFAKRASVDAAAWGQAAPALADNSTPPGGSDANATAAAAGPTTGAAPAAASPQAQPGLVTPPATAAAPAASVPATAPAGPAITAVAPAAAKPLIVLDPGHGGIDNGATAPNGIHEKNIVLAFALKLQALLIKSGRFDVALTRTDDSYLTLEQRVALARQNKADLFISLHADTFGQPAIRGTSIYTRDEQATDVLDKVLADKENKFDIVSGFAVPKMTPATVDVLVDLMRRQMRKQSFLAAESIIHELQPSIELRRFPVRQADFFVLQAPDVPSMLVELGFMSNTDDITNLTDPQWQDRVADALARGIAAYFDQMAQQ